MSWFGGGKKEAPKPKTLLQMNKEELDAAQKQIKDELKQSMREMERQVFGRPRLTEASKTTLKQAEKKLETAVKKKEDKSIQKMYAKNVLTARAGMERLMKHKVRIMDVQYGIDDIFSNIKLTKTMGNSSQIMAKISSLTSITEINSIATNLQTNLTQMGVVGEMVDDAMDTMDEDTVGDDAVGSLLRRPSTRCSAKWKTSTTRRKSKPNSRQWKWEKKKTIWMTCSTNSKTNVKSNSENRHLCPALHESRRVPAATASPTASPVDAEPARKFPRLAETSLCINIRRSEQL